MAKVIVTLRVMPESPTVDLAHLYKDVARTIQDYIKQAPESHTEEPVAFGLKALKIVFKMGEDLGGTEPLEMEIAKLAGVMSCDVVGLDRTF